MKFFLLSLLLTHSVRAEDRRFIFERPLMGTIFTITCHGPDKASANAAADAAFQRASEINAVASDYIADSEMLKLSGKTGQSNAISPSLFDLLQRAMHFARLTDGSFDPTLGPLTKLWRETRRNGKLPTSSTLESAKNASGYRLLTLDPTASTVNLTRSGMRLDLGGIAKADARQTGVSGSIAVPIFSQSADTVVGTLGIGKYAPYEFTTAEKQRLATHAEEIAALFGSSALGDD